MKIFYKYFIFAVIGILPTVIAGYQCWDWKWWAVVAPLWAGVWMRDYAMRLGV